MGFYYFRESMNNLISCVENIIQGSGFVLLLSEFILNIKLKSNSSFLNSCNADVKIALILGSTLQ